MRRSVLLPRSDLPPGKITQIHLFALRLSCVRSFIYLFNYYTPAARKEDDGFGTGGRRFCDCTTATDILDSKTLFAGKWCENKATDVCGITGEGALPHFCVNDGLCSKKKGEACDCPDGYSGPFCEYKGDAPKCSLQCKNGGGCRHGINYKFEGGITEKFDLGDAFKQGHINFEYCSCPGKYM